MKATYSRFLSSLLLVVLLAGASGCLTCNTIDSARTKTHKDKSGQVIVDQKGHPAQYAWLPFAIPLDVATSPFQAFYAGFITLIMLGYHGC